MADKKGRKHRPGVPPRRSHRVLTHSRSTDSIRADFRLHFVERLRISRSRSVDRFRLLVENYGDALEVRSVLQVRRALQNDPVAANLLQDAEVNNILNEIEAELAQLALEDQAEQHDSASASENEDIVGRHLIPCAICGQMNEEGAACDRCHGIQLDPPHNIQPDPQLEIQPDRQLEIQPDPQLEIQPDPQHDIQPDPQHDNQPQ